MKMGKVFMRYMWIAGLVWLMAENAYADAAPGAIAMVPVNGTPAPAALTVTPVTPALAAAGKGNFIALSAERSPVHAKAIQPVASAPLPSHFIAFGPHNFRAAPATSVSAGLVTRHAEAAPKREEASVAEVSAELPDHISKVHGLMPAAQAQQILSIFEPQN